MKRILVLLTFMLLVNLSVGQASDVGYHSVKGATYTDTYKIDWGIKAGLDYSNLFGTDVDYIFFDKKTSFQPGFHGGFFVKNHLAKYFALGHELQYKLTRSGVHMSDSVHAPYNSNLTLHYLELAPIHLHFQVNGFSVFAGPYISALLGAHIQRKDLSGKIFKDKSIFGGPDIDESEEKYLQKIDFGMSAGIEYQFRSNFLIGFRYTQGWIDLFQYANSYDLGDERNRFHIKKRSLELSVGYAF